MPSLARPASLRSQQGTALPPSPSAPPAVPVDDHLTLVSRATFGYTPAEYQRARALGFDGWLNEQLAPTTIDDSDLDDRLSKFDTLSMDLETLYNTPLGSGTGDHHVNLVLRDARLLRARYSKRQLFERVVEFWTDHFNVPGDRAILRYLKTIDDRIVARAHGLGSFRELLGASAKSPAMLEYLDTEKNVKRGLNENYARELMELHTLGIDGGYTEDDVENVARCFTGWAAIRYGLPNAGAFDFRPEHHDDGPKVVLGVHIPAGGGVQDGETVLDILSAHPSTADFLAKKLCRYFLAYEPAPATVARVAARFTATGGDLAQTMRAVLSRRSFGENPFVRLGKLKRPLMMVVSALRATDASSLNMRGIVEQLLPMGHRPYSWPAPDGYPDRLETWGTSLLPRWTFASRLLDTEISGTRIGSTELYALVGGTPREEIGARLNERLTGGRMTRPDVAEVQAYVDALPVWNLGQARGAVALALSVPSFQFL